MTSAQFEAVSAEALVTADPGLVTGTVFAEALATADAGLQVEAVFVEVLATLPTDLRVGTVFAEVLVPSLLQVGSNVYDETGTQREVYQWTGAVLVPVTFTP